MPISYLNNFSIQFKKRKLAIGKLICSILNNSRTLQFLRSCFHVNEHQNFTLKMIGTSVNKLFAIYEHCLTSSINQSFKITKNHKMLNKIFIIIDSNMQLFLIHQFVVNERQEQRHFEYSRQKYIPNCAALWTAVRRFLLIFHLYTSWKVVYPMDRGFSAIANLYYLFRIKTTN